MLWTPTGKFADLGTFREEKKREARAGVSRLL
jgi:hypothetical protein